MVLKLIWTSEIEEKKKMFIYTNQPLITSFYIKKYLFFAESAMSQRWSAIFYATGAWGWTGKYR